MLRRRLLASNRAQQAPDLHHLVFCCCNNIHHDILLHRGRHTMLASREDMESDRGRVLLAGFRQSWPECWM